LRWGPGGPGYSASGSTTQFAYDQAEGLPLVLQAGSVEYITGPNGLPVEQVSGSTVRYYLADQLGSTAGLVDTSGTVQDSYSYDPYGQRTVVSGSASDTPFGYAGQYTDSESGLQYLRARYYDPATGQFLTPDPLADLPGGHPYAYAADDPINFSDPWGLCQHSELGVCLDIVTDTASAAGQRAGNAAGWVSHQVANAGGAVVGPNGPIYGAGQALSSAASSTLTLLHIAATINNCADPILPGSCNPQALGQQNLNTLALTAYIVYHPDDALSQSWTAIIIPYVQDIQCGRYGRATGRGLGTLLLFFFARGTGATEDTVGGAGAIRIFRIEEPGNPNPGITLEQAADAAQRNGIDMRMFELAYEEAWRRGIKGSSSFTPLNRFFTAYQVYRTPSGRFLLTLTNEGLADEQTAVATIAHELNHVRGVLNNGVPTSEVDAEIAAMFAEEYFVGQR
jgi:RHS repeat-associated protein